MTRPKAFIFGFLSLCLGLLSCMPTNDPPRFHKVSVVGSFSTTDSALGFGGTITAPAGGIHLDFKVYGGGTEKTEMFLLEGAAPAVTTTSWDLSGDSRLRLVNRSAPVDSYTLALVAVDADGISDSIHLPFSVTSTGIHFLEMISLEVNLSLASSSGVNLEEGRLVSVTSPSAKDATFFLSFQHSSSGLSGLSWLALVPPALLDPPLANASQARNDTRFFTSSSMDTSSTPEQVSKLLASRAPLDESAGLTMGQTVYFSTATGLVGRFLVDSLAVNQKNGFVRLVGAYSKKF